MVDPITARAWLSRALFLSLVALIALGRLLPLGGMPGGLPGPDLILALTFAWVLRRPSFVPVWLLVPLFLCLDMLFQQPPGLGTALMLLGAEFLRARREMSRELPFLVEWALVTAVLLAMVAGEQLVLAVFAVERPALGLDIMRALATAAAYPVVAFLSATLFGVRKPSPGEVDALGDRV